VFIVSSTMCPDSRYNLQPEIAIWKTLKCNLQIRLCNRPNERG